MINQRDSNRRRNAVIDENEARDENKKKETLQLKRRNMHRRHRFKTKKFAFYCFLTFTRT